jgi:hypothetical protein
MNQYLRLFAVLFVIVAVGAPATAQDVQPFGVRVAVQDLVAPVPPAPAGQQEFRSARAAATLVALLEAHKLDAIAARDPEVAGNVVAAFYMPGSQLLVVSAPYPSTALFDKRVAEGKYMDIYLDVNATASHKGHFFVMDLEANGLQRVCDPNQPFDSTSREGGQTVAFDGNWTAQQLSEADYSTRFAEDDARYGALLDALAQQLRQPKRLTMR